MQKLVKGIHAFQKGYFATHRQLFEQLATNKQQPETLFITCSDSRIMPDLITNSAPGELFMVRNEFAVSVLNVENIIVCGHTQCGAMQAILDPERMANLKFVKRWLEQTETVKRVIEEKYAHLEGEARLNAAVEENVLAQLEHLREYPFVAERLDSGTLHLNGWVFHIQRGEVFDFDPELGEFVNLSSAGTDDK